MRNNIGIDMKRFILTLVHIRKRLINRGKSLKDHYIMASNTDFLEKHLHAYNYSDDQLILFFARHAGKIYSIMPGEESKCGPALHKKYSYYLTIAQSYAA
jgi:hypothetical protein